MCVCLVKWSICDVCAYMAEFKFAESCSLIWVAWTYMRQVVHVVCECVLCAHLARLFTVIHVYLWSPKNAQRFIVDYQSNCLPIFANKILFLIRTESLAIDKGNRRQIRVLCVKFTEPVGDMLRLGVDYSRTIFQKTVLPQITWTAMTPICLQQNTYNSSFTFALYIGSTMFCEHGQRETLISKRAPRILRIYVWRIYT